MNFKEKCLKKDELLVVLFFLLIGLAFLLPLFLSKGIIVGGDWAFPYTRIQSDLWLRNAFSPWVKFTLIGNYEPVQSSLPFIFVINLFFRTGLSGAFIAKFLLLLYMFFSGINMYFLLKYLGLNKVSSMVGGFIYLTSPFVFNFMVIGWTYMLFSMAMLPLFIKLFMRSIREKRINYLAYCLLVYNLALSNSTTIVWYSLVVFALGFSFIRDAKLLKRYLLYSLLLYMFLILLNLYWLVNLFMFKDYRVFGSENVLSSVSLGMWIRFKLQNIIRGWGTIFNNSYESSYLDFLSLVSFSGFLMALYGAIKVKVLKNIRKESLYVILLYPFAVYFLGAYGLSKIPFANIIRDPGRNIALVSLVSVVFMAVFVNYWYERNRKVFYLTLVFVFLNAHPFILWKLYDDNGLKENIKLRTFHYAQDYLDVERFLYRENTAGKVLSVPITNSSQDYSDPRFYGEYRGFQSTFFQITPIPGFVRITDKEAAGSNTFYYTFTQKLMEEFNDSIEVLLKKLDVEYLVFYFNKMNPSDWFLYDKVNSSALFKEITEESLGYVSDRVAIYEVNDPSLGVKTSSNFIFSNEEKVYIFDPLLQYLNDYEILYTDQPESFERYPYLVFPERFYSVDLNNMKPPGFSLPLYVQPPSNLFSYQLGINKEKSRVKNAVDFREEFNLLLDYNSNRLAEVVLYPDAEIEISFTGYVDNYEDMKEILGQVPIEERDLGYFLLMQELFTHVNYADSVFETHDFEPYKNISYSEENRRTLFEDFKEWLLENTIICQGICFYFDKEEEGDFIQSNVESYEIIEDDHKIYDFESNDDLLISYEDFLDSEIFTSGNLENDPILKSLVDLTSISLQDKEKDQFIDDMENVVHFRLEGTIPSANYEFNLNYLGTDPRVGIAIIEEYTSLKDDFVVGAKRDNYEIKKRLAYFLTPTNPTEIGDNLFSVNRLLQSDVATRSFYILLFNVYEEEGYKVKDFSFAEKKLPVIYYEHNISEPSNIEVDLIYKQESQSRYIVRGFNEISGDQVLVLNQQYDAGWKLYDGENKEINVPHYMANGYANAWLLNDEILKESAEVIIEFEPARYSRIGLYFSISFYLLLFGYLCADYFYLCKRKR